MDSTITVALIVTVPPTLAALGALLVAIRSSRKVDDNKKELILTKEGIFELGARVDGKMEKLLELTEKAARAEGELEGRAASIANGIVHDKQEAEKTKRTADALAEASADKEVPVATRLERKATEERKSGGEEGKITK